MFKSNFLNSHIYKVVLSLDAEGYNPKTYASSLPEVISDQSTLCGQSNNNYSTTFSYNGYNKY